MIKQVIKYEDFNGDERTEDFYFSLTKLEMMELEIDHPGGLHDYILQLTETTEGPEAYHLFKKIILQAYGKKSPDGRNFWKVDPDNGRKYAEEFVTSPAMTELIFGFLENGNSAAEFIRGLLPAKMVAEVREDAAKKKSVEEGQPALAAVPEPKVEEPPAKKPEDYSRDQLLAMPDDEFDKLVGTDPSKMAPAVLQVAYQRKARGN